MHSSSNYCKCTLAYLQVNFKIFEVQRLMVWTIYFLSTYDTQEFCYTICTRQQVGLYHSWFWLMNFGYRLLLLHFRALPSSLSAMGHHLLRCIDRSPCFCFRLLTELHWFRNLINIPYHRLEPVLLYLSFGSCNSGIAFAHSWSLLHSRNLLNLICSYNRFK